MKALLYKICLKLKNKHLIPWALWSIVYDHCHRSVNDPWG